MYVSDECFLYQSPDCNSPKDADFNQPEWNACIVDRVIVLLVKAFGVVGAYGGGKSGHGEYNLDRSNN